MKTCPHCLSRIPDAAECPKCGKDTLAAAAPLKKAAHSWPRGSIVASLLVATALIGQLVMHYRSPVPAASTVQDTPKQGIDKSQEKQSVRKALIDKIIREGGFTKIETGSSIAKAWVTPAFMATDVDTKKNLIGIVYAYSFDGDSMTDFVDILDYRTGKRLGTFSAFGLKFE